MPALALATHLMPEPCVSRLGAIAVEFPFGLGPGLLGKRPGKIKPSSVNCSHHVYHIGVHRSFHSSSSSLLILLPVAKAATDTSISDDPQASLGPSRHDWASSLQSFIGFIPDAVLDVPPETGLLSWYSGADLEVICIQVTQVY